MKVSIFGSGYVGLVTGACLAEVGHEVVCCDIDEEKIRQLRGGHIPIYEPGLEPLIVKNIAAGHLRFTTDTTNAVHHGKVIFIAVGTPPDEDGSADLTHVRDVARSIGENLQSYAVVANKSTVPVGTAQIVTEEINARLKQRGETVDFDVISNPEFLKEGSAVNDFMRPDRIIIGAASERALTLLTDLYSPFNRNHNKLMAMDVASAELTKYAANAMLATKISFMNEVAGIAEKVGADIEAVRQGIGSDPRIGYHFIYPGPGFGGSCFPKDVRALAAKADSLGIDAQLIKAVESVNIRQKMRLFEKISAHFDGAVKGLTVAIWGLSFKPNTDDMREAPSRTLMEALWAAGANVRAHDPVAMPETSRLYGDRDDLVLCDTKEEALEGADCLVLVTEWRDFQSPDFEHIKSMLRDPVIFDGRNIYEPKRARAAGLTVVGIGRGAPS
ncbi:MAG TPA: UDP-glucose/GDP-mannose dehydrogenase family protein [Gammaproteobacteria bacterium]